MSNGSLTDLDPPAARERRWPFYLVWFVGGVAIAAAMSSRLPAAVTRPIGPIAGPAVTDAPATPLLAPRFRVAPGAVGPARP